MIQNKENNHPYQNQYQNQNFLQNPTINNTHKQTLITFQLQNTVKNTNLSKFSLKIKTFFLTLKNSLSLKVTVEGDIHRPLKGKIESRVVEKQINQLKKTERQRR